MSRRWITITYGYNPPSAYGISVWHKHQLVIDADLEDPVPYVESEAETLLRSLIRDMSEETGNYCYEFMMGDDTYRRGIEY